MVWAHIEDGTPVFRSVVSPSEKRGREGKKLEAIIKKAGLLDRTRRNPMGSPLHLRPGTLANEKRTAYRLPGAAPALRSDYSTGRQGERRRLVTGLAALGVLVGLAWLGGQHERGLVARTFVLQGSSQNAGPVLY